MFAIRGSGFGLYGYLPALVDGCGQSIVLPERYRARFNERCELARYADNVIWEADETRALGCAGGAVISLRPIDQVRCIPSCLARPNIKRLLLEKPLAPSPALSAEIFDELIRSQKKFRIGYNFRYTVWGQRLLDELGSTNESGVLSIHWDFFAHHFSHDLHNWKRFNSEGGGAIRFYGIHIIALLAEIGYHDVDLSSAFGISSDALEKWVAIVTGSGLPKCEIVINTRATQKKFHVEYRSSEISRKCTLFANLSDPFGVGNKSGQEGGIDPRVPMLSRLCHSLWENGSNEYEWYKATIKLWHRIENKTLFEMIGL